MVVVLFLDIQSLPPAVQLEEELLRMEDVLRELRGEPCPSCKVLHKVIPAEQLPQFEAWLRSCGALAPEAIKRLQDCITDSTWANDGYASVEEVQGHITRLQRLFDWSEGRLLEGNVVS